MSTTTIEEAMKRILDFPKRYLSTIRRIRPDDSSGSNQILLELQMTDELLERINFCNRKAKSYKYSLQIEEPPKSEVQVV
jgi:hypothetical protein